MLNAGDFAPPVSLPLAGGGSFVLSEAKGGAVLFFYPKADTSGCTQEAQEFSMLVADFTALGVALAGISPDPMKAVEKFREKHGLAVPLAADPERTAIEPYGVWGEKSMYGRKYMGVMRTTVLVAPDGRIAQLWPAVKVPGHAAQVLEAAQGLNTA